MTNFKKLRSDLRDLLHITLGEINNKETLIFPDFTGYLLKYKSPHLNKTMVIQLADEDIDSQFRYIVGKEGILPDINYLCLIFTDPKSHVNFISEVYKTWFIDDCQPIFLEQNIENMFNNFKES